MPNGETIPDVHRGEPPASSLGRHSPKRFLPSTRPHSSAETPSPAKPPLRATYRSPPVRNLPGIVLKFTLDELRFVRLTLKTIPTQIFELRRYTFSPDIPIPLKIKNVAVMPVPPEEQIV